MKTQSISPIRIFLCLMAILATPSCQIVESNLDPGRPVRVDLRLQLPAMLTQTAFNQVALTARVSGGIMQYLDGPGYLHPYNLTPNTFDSYWTEGVYGGALKDAKQIIEQAETEGQAYYRGIARIIMAENFGMLASMFGDVPFSEALQGKDNLLPAYDAQKDVYAGIQNLLDLAIQDLSQEAVSGGPGQEDLIFGGNAAAWIATAYALKARYIMHLSKREETAAPLALEWINNGAFDSPEEQAYFSWSREPNEQNPLAVFAKERRNTYLIHEELAKRMTQRQDPRIDKYMIFNFSYWEYYQENSDLHWSQEDARIPLISLSEIMFLKAEALLYTGATKTEIRLALREAITSNMKELGLRPEEYESYLDQWTELSSLAQDEQILERIITEAYFAYYGMAFQQSWTNYRRTSYPALEAESGGIHYEYNPNGEIPLRFLYPISEQLTNYENWNQARLQQGGANLDSDTWAFADW